MKLDEARLQEVVEKIAYQQFGEEQIDDLYAKMGILNDYVQEQLRLFAVVQQSEQLPCDHEFTHKPLGGNVYCWKCCALQTK